MDLRAAAGEFFSRSKDLLDRMKSAEGETLTQVDLHILRVQCQLLDAQATTLQQAIAARRSPPLDTPSQTPVTVLFVDPNEKDRQSWSDRLTLCSSDYFVLHAADGQTALSLARSKEVDCVVLELDLPDKPGLKVLHELVQTARKPQIPVVALSGSALQSLFPLARQGGAQSCFRKDETSIEDLDRAIRRAIAVVSPGKHITLRSIRTEAK